MVDVRIIDLDPGSVNDNHLFESDDGSTSFKITAIDLRAYCQNGLTPQSIGIAAGVTTAELNFLDGVTSGVQGQIDGKVSTSVTINTASGLTGGGNLSADRTISLDISALQSKTAPSSSDQVLIYDPVSLTHKRITVSGITAGISGGGGVTAHSALTGLNLDDHPQYSLADGTRWTAAPTANRVVISTASGVIASSSISTTELAYLSSVTSPIQEQINNKTDSGHTHTIANINNLQPSLDSKPSNSRIINAASGLTGGGDLSADRTISLDVSALQSKTAPSSSDQVLIYDPVSLTHKRITVSGITAGLQPLLVSEANIKTINNQSILGPGNLTIAGGGGSSPTITTLTDAAIVTPNVDTTTIGILLSLSQNTTIANPIGTPANYQELVIRISSSSIRRLTWGNIYAASTSGLLPNTTSGGGREDYFQFRYNTLDNKWDLVQTNQPSDEVELSYLTSSLILTGNL